MTWLSDLDDFAGKGPRRGAEPSGTLWCPLGERALDVGTGSGHFARELAGRYRQVVGVDSAAAVARATPHPGVEYLEMDAGALAFPDASFDLVAVSWSLHHLLDPSGVLLEMQRVLAPGGRCLIVEPFNAASGTNQDHHLAAHLLVAEVDRLAGKPHFPIFGRMQIGSVIQGLGLLDIQFKPVLLRDDERDWDVLACLSAAAPWIEKLERLAADDSLPRALRERASALVTLLERDGLRTQPVMRTYGTKPGARGG